MLLVPAAPVSAAAIASASAAVSTASAPVSAAEFLLRSGFVDGDGLAVQRAAVEFLDGRRRSFFRLHFDKAESFGLAGKPVLDNGRGNDFARFREVGLQIFIRNFEGQIADI